MRARTVTLLVVAVLVAAACGDSASIVNIAEDADAGAAPTERDDDAASAAPGGEVAAGGGEPSCGMTTPEVVAVAFEGTSAVATVETLIDGAQVCQYSIANGLIPRVIVRLIGPAAQWTPLYREHQSGLPITFGVGFTFVDVDEVGDAAFYYRDSLIVRMGVQSGDVVFTAYFAISEVRPPVTGRQLDLALTELVKAIADG